jgi:hypothetical protein
MYAAGQHVDEERVGIYALEIEKAPPRTAHPRRHAHDDGILVLSIGQQVKMIGT